MKMHAILFISGALGFVAHGAEDDRPILKEPTSRVVALLDSHARADFFAACVNVTRDAKEKRLRIFAVTPPPWAKTGTTNISDISVEVIYDGDLAGEDKMALGAYHRHNNLLVLGFAASEFASGNKELGLKLVQILANAFPEMFWSSATQVLTVMQILEGMTKDDASIRHFLKQESGEWANRVKRYGPRGKVSSK